MIGLPRRAVNTKKGAVLAFLRASDDRLLLMDQACSVLVRPGSMRND